MLIMDCSGDTKRFYKSYDSELVLVNDSAPKDASKKSNNNIEDKKVIKDATSK
jgi:hypothetical protein